MSYGDDGLAYDQSLVTVACLLHDTGKVYTLPSIAGGFLPEEAHHINQDAYSILIIRAAATQAEPLPPERLARLTHAILDIPLLQPARRRSRVSGL